MTGNLKDEELHRIARRIAEAEQERESAQATLARADAKLNALYAEEIEVETW